MKKLLIALLLMAIPAVSAAEWNYLGNTSSNKFMPNSINNKFGAGNPFNPNSINNKFGKYGNPFSNKSATNPFATNPPVLFDSQGNYKGKYSKNPFLPDSTSNPFGRYGNPSSGDSINNQFGAGNPFGEPLDMYGQ